MSITVVYNPSSGTVNNLDAIKAAFAHHNVQPTYLPITSTSLHRHVKSELAKAHTVIVAAGGDGTVNAVASMVQGTRAKFGVIPSGTLNHFAKDAGLPLKVADAVSVILRGKTRSIDAASVNKRVFVNNASIGLYPRSLRTRAQYDGRIGKWPAAIISAVRVLLKPRRYRVTLTLDGKTITRRTPFVFVGNNPYQLNKPPIMRRNTLEAGTLGVHIIKANSAYGVLRMFAHALFTKRRRTAEFETYTVTVLKIATKHHRTLHVAYDGEVVSLTTPLIFTALPKTLRLLCRS